MRRVMFAMGSALLVTVLVAPSAGAAPAPAPAGTIGCGLTGKVSFSRPMLNAELDPKPGRTTVRITAQMTNCNASGVTGGRTRITGGTLTASGFVEEAGCADLDGGYPPDFTFDTNRFSARWTGAAPSGRGVTTVGQSRTVMSYADTLFGGWLYETDLFGDKDAFAGEYASLKLYLDEPAMVDACARGETGLDGKPVNLPSASFSAERGARIVVQP